MPEQDLVLKPPPELKPPPVRPQILDEDGCASTETDSSAEPVAMFTRKKEVTCPTCKKGRACGVVVKATQGMAKGQKRGEHAAATRVMVALREGGHRPSARTYTTYLSTLTSARRNEDAETALFREMPMDGTVPDEPCYNVVVHAWCSARQPARAEAIIRKMVEAGVTPSVNTFGPLLLAFGEAGSLASAEKVLEQMESLGVWPKETTYNQLVKGLCNAGELSNARLVLDRMLNDSLHMERVSTRGDAVRPSCVSFGHLMDALCRQEKMGDARRLLAKMKWEAIRPSTALFNMLIRGYAFQGNLVGAESVLREMEGSGEWDCEALGIRPDATTYSTLMNMWADNPSQQGVEKVRSLQKKMLASGVRLDDVVYGTLTKAYLRARRPAEAEAVLSEMHAAGLKPGVVVWTSIIAAWVNASEMDEAQRVLKEMRSDSCGGAVKPNHMTFHHLVWGWGKAGDPVAAYNVLKDMESAGLKPNETTYSLLKEAYESEGLDPPAEVLAEAAKVGPNTNAQRRKSMRARGKDGRLLTTIAAEAAAIRSAREAANASRELDETTSATEYWQQEWEMFLRSSTEILDSGNDRQGGSGRGARIPRGTGIRAGLGMVVGDDVPKTTRFSLAGSMGSHNRLLKILARSQQKRVLGVRHSRLTMVRTEKPLVLTTSLKAVVRPMLRI